MPKLPGFVPDYPLALLPFWGNHCLIDFFLANVADLPIKIILEDPGHGLSLALSGRWKTRSVDVHVLENGLEDFLEIIEGEEAETLLICSLTSVSVFDPAALLDLVAANKDELVKASLQKTPVEMFAARRRHLARLLSRGAARARKATRSREYLFEGILGSSIDLIEEIPGRLLYQNDLAEFFRQNLWLATHASSEEYNRMIARLPELSARMSESRISERGFVKDSFLSAGAEVEGYVENSVIFPNVVVRANAKIIDSVIATNNRVGVGSVVRNTLILPYSAEGPRNASNIGDNCVLGGASSSAQNQDFPDQIADGLTVVGMNVAVPGGFKAEPGSFIGAGSSASHLRRVKVLKKGTSFFEDGK